MKYLINYITLFYLVNMYKKSKSFNVLAILTLTFGKKNNDESVPSANTILPLYFKKSTIYETF